MYRRRISVFERRLGGSTKGAAFDGCAASSWLALSPQGLLSLAGASVPTAFFSRSRTAGTTSGSLRKSPGSLSVSKLSAHERELLFGISGSLSLRSGEAALPRLALGPRGFRIPKPDQSGLWPHGLTQVKRAYSPVGYVIKYSSKGGLEEHDIPKGARLFGVGGGGDAERLATHRAGLPMWLFARLEPGARARRVARLGWVCSITGEIFSSPFSVTWGGMNGGFHG